MPSQQPLVAIVDDDPSIRDTTKDLLESAGLRAATFASAEAFLASAQLDAVSCVIADMRMPGASGLALHEQLMAAGRRLPVILMTAYPEPAARSRAQQAGVLAYLTKPFADDELLEWIGVAVDTA